MFYCPMCNAKVSIKAPSCEKCGYILSEETPSPTPISAPGPGLIRPVGITPPPTHPSNPPPSSQFIRPAFLPSKGQLPNTKQVSAQQVLQAPAQQISPAQQPPPQYAPAAASQTGQAPTSPTTQTPPELLAATPHPIEIVKGRPQLIHTDEQFQQFEDGAESYVATSVAAEHWRTSWRNRQRSEAGPATEVSRGHSSVPEPLLAMQHSFMRMRAVIAPNRQEEGASPGLWIAIVLMLFLIVGVGVYIASTFAPNSDNAAHSNAPISADTPQPALMIQGTPIASISQGQTLHLHGTNFDAGAPIIFLLDGPTAIAGTDGREISLFASDQGTFDVALPITSIWSPGQHLIQAQDNKNNQSAYLFIRVNPVGTTPTANADLSLSLT